MSGHIQVRSTGVLVIVTVLVGLGFCTVSATLSTLAEEPKYDGTKTPTDEPAKTAPAPKPGDPKREKAVTDFERRLGQLRPAGKDKRKSADDYYLLATADVTSATKSADVRFMTLQGQRKTAEFLVDYVANAPENTLHKWHVFARFKDAAEVERALASARTQYDQMVAYREQLQKIYAVQSTRRC